MKRLIKYRSQYGDLHFSNCSTEYDVLPVLVSDKAGPKALEKIAKELGYKFKKQAKKNKYRSKYATNHAQVITHHLELTKKIEISEGVYFRDKKKKVSEYLGFITIDERGCLTPVEDCKGVITPELTQEIYNNQDYYIEQPIELRDGWYVLIDGWEAFHHFALLGYGTFKDFLKKQDIKYSIFHDEVFCCSECGTWDYNDDGYTYNYRIFECEILGLNECGCANEFAKNNLDYYTDNSDECIDSDAADELVEDKKIKKLETFIGGMVDGRGGYIGGESVREGQPSDILSEFKEKHPNTEFVFVHEESGQFQTYFSIYKLL